MSDCGERNPRFLHEERSSVLAARRANEVRRDALKKEIEELETRLENAKSDFSLVAQEMVSQDATLCPIHRVPASILRDIFFMAAPSTFVGLRHMTLTAPWILLRVCKYWHEVCLMHGSLWSHINIDASDLRMPEFPLTLVEARVTNRARVPEKMTRVVKRACALLILQLQRSGEANLTIAIQTQDRLNHAQPFWRILLPHLHRCKELKAPLHLIVDTPFSQPPNRLNRLSLEYDVDDIFSTTGRLIEMSNHPRMVESLSHSLFDQLEAFPHISLILGGAIGSHIRIFKTRAWMLSTLVLTFGSQGISGISELRPLFAEAKNLAVLEIDAEGELNLVTVRRSSGSCSWPPILPKLRHLAVRRAVDTYIADYIAAPGLTSLSYSLTGKARIDVHALVTFIERSEAKLRTFRLLAEMDVNPDKMQALFSPDLDIWDSLETLQLNVAPRKRLRNAVTSATVWNPLPPWQSACEIITTATVLRLLTRPRLSSLSSGTGSAAVRRDSFPALQELELGWMAPDARSLLDMIESRRHKEPGTDGCVQLARCRLAHLSSVHQRHSPSELKSLLRGAALRSLHIADAEEAVSPWEPATQETFRGEVVNEVIPWGEGLEREPQEKARLERLIEGGLEVWMR